MNIFFLLLVGIVATSAAKDPCVKPYHMDAADLEIFDRVTTNARYYFEYGGGFSTLRVACRSKTIKAIHTTDSDQKWLAKVAEGIPGSLFTPHWIDIGPIGVVGRPKDTSNKSNWPSYADSILGATDSIAPAHFDVVMVDGRFRVACALQAMITTPTATFLWHDFVFRSGYHVIKPYIDVKDSGVTMIEFTRRAGVSDLELETMLKRFHYKPS